ncbi:flavodoxin-dependent (E)-4-hydroxy-3-methylbut-2-enyl-diphosphate synthase [Fervidobacterium gondwanense]|nr:flavodoxin-dependent (E)-4-hydroxy-3-methylbut-2-enyl-diphosphate synthase [Fervidobacterium gondwanense]
MCLLKRRFSKPVKVGNLTIGGDAPITIQSMTNTNTKDVASTVNQIKSLVEAGCEIVRISLPDIESAKAIKYIKDSLKSFGIDIPIVGDIHFDYRIAIEAIKEGIDKVRINPGNIGDENKVAEVVKYAKEFGVPIRVGANSGSLPKDLENLPKHKAIGEAALREVRILEKQGFEDIVISVKSSDVIETIEANRYVGNLVDYPLHVGVTEAGTLYNSLIKSSVALGVLILEGLVDTLRISIAGDPVNEVIAAKKLLTALHLRKGPNIVACPTCARTVFDVESVALEVEKLVSNIRGDITISVLGCVVNGIGEGKEADVGIAGVKDGVVLFRKGEIVGTYKFEEGLRELKRLIDGVLREKHI